MVGSSRKGTLRTFQVQQQQFKHWIHLQHSTTCHAEVAIRLKVPRVQIQTPYAADVFNELSGQLNLTRDHKNKESPYLQACPQTLS